MSEQDNVRVVEEYWEAMNDHDYGRMSSHHGKGFQFHVPDRVDPGDNTAYGVYMQGLWTTFSDLIFQPTQTIAQGDYVVVNWIATGTHNGPLPTPTGDTVPATGRKIALPGSDTMEFKDGKIMRVRAYLDMMTLLAQLGLLPGA